MPQTFYSASNFTISNQKKKERLCILCKLTMGKDLSQSLICSIIDMTIMILWQYRVMGGSAL